MTEVVLALILRDGRYFLQRRDSANPVLPGLWEFPGGKVEPSETPLEALRRELQEEVGLVLDAHQALPVLEGRLRLHPFLIECRGNPHTALAWGWFTPEEMLRLPIPPANAPLVHSLMEAPK